MAAGYYVAAYFVTILGAFGVISMLSGADGEPDLINEYKGLGWSNPWLAGVFSAVVIIKRDAFDSGLFRKILSDCSRNRIEPLAVSNISRN